MTIEKVLKGVNNPDITIKQFSDELEKENVEEVLKKCEKLNYVYREELTIISILYLTKQKNNLALNLSLRNEIKDILKKHKINIENIDIYHLIIRDKLLRKKNIKLVTFFLKWLDRR